jgi:diaminopimelate decarboxylase
VVAENPGRFGVRLQDGILHVEDVSLELIADEVGTPVFVYGAAHIEARYRGLVEALAGRPATICYAVKANSSQAILRHLARLGAGADIVSGGELERVLAAGMDPSKVVFSGVGKRAEELDAALRAGIRSINVESEEEIEHLARRARALGARAPVSLRVNPDVDPETHPYLATGLREAKFGIPFDRAQALAERVHRTDELELVGLACHIGSQISTSRPFLDSLARMRVLIDGLRERGITLRQLDLGGGMGIPYTGDDDELDVEAWGRALRDATADLDLEIVLEPGRYLVGNAGVLLTRVLGRKRGEERRFVIVDAAMNDLVRPALYDAYHTVAPVRVPPAGASVEAVDVVGPICECGDFLAQQRSIPWPELGDLLVVLSAGAYAMTMASNYNTRPKAAEVFVSGSRWAVTRERRTVADLIAEETQPDWLEDAGSSGG